MKKKLKSVTNTNMMSDPLAGKQYYVTSSSDNFKGLVDVDDSLSLIQAVPGFLWLLNVDNSGPPPKFADLTGCTLFKSNYDDIREFGENGWKTTDQYLDVAHNIMSGKNLWWAGAGTIREKGENKGRPTLVVFAPLIKGLGDNSKNGFVLVFARENVPPQLNSGSDSYLLQQGGVIYGPDR